MFSEVDSDGDEIVDDSHHNKSRSAAAAAAAADADADDDAAGTDGSAGSYYVWYAVSVDVSPADPIDTLTVSCHCLVSTIYHCDLMLIIVIIDCHQAM